MHGLLPNHYYRIVTNLNFNDGLRNRRRLLQFMTCQQLLLVPFDCMLHIRITELGQRWGREELKIVSRHKTCFINVFAYRSPKRPFWAQQPTEKRLHTIVSHFAYVVHHIIEVNIPFFQFTRKRNLGYRVQAHNDFANVMPQLVYLDLDTATPNWMLIFRGTLHHKYDFFRGANYNLFWENVCKPGHCIYLII